jgi:hypothetical protein
LRYRREIRPFVLFVIGGDLAASFKM